MRIDRARWLAALLLVLVVTCVASLAVGSRPVAPTEVWQALIDPDGSFDHAVVREVRVPRTLLGLLVGAALGAAGALIQTMTRNPLAEPGLLGVTAGASFAIVVMTAWGGTLGDSQVGQVVSALVGAVAAAALVLAVGRTSPLRLLLAGVALDALLLGVTLGLRLMDPAAFDRHRFWSVGTLAGREQLDLLVPAAVVAAALVGAVLITRPLAALALGDDVAHGLGIPVRLTRVLVAGLVVVLAAAATAVAGPIVFLGLMVPHLARRIADGSVGWLMAYTLVIGPALLVAADVVARVLLTTGEVPVAVVMAFIGAPVLIWIVRRHGTVAL